MSEDTKDTSKPARKPLGLKRSVEPGEVKQTFSHGRTNKVVVEVKRKKLVGKPGAQEAAKEIVKETPVPAPAPVAAKKPAPAPVAPKPDALTRQEMQAKLLREAEEARLSANEAARKRDTKAKKAQTAEEKERAEENRKVEEEAAKKAQEEIAAAEKAAAEAADAAADASAAPEPEEAAAAAKHPPARKFTPVETPKRVKPEKVKSGKAERNDRRQSGKLTVTSARAVKMVQHGRAHWQRLNGRVKKKNVRNDRVNRANRVRSNIAK